MRVKATTMLLTLHFRSRSPFADPLRKSIDAKPCAGIMPATTDQRDVDAARTKENKSGKDKIKVNVQV